MENFIVQTCWYFFIYGFLGWCAEVVFHTAITGKWVNRGFLNGPICPIYGFGMLLILLVLDPLKNNIFLLFIGSVLLTSSLEFITGWTLKNLFHLTWWDYSNRPFNLGGYICLKFSIMWGVAGVIIVEIIHPIVQRFVESLPLTIALFFVILFSAILILDFIATLTTLVGFKHDLRELERVGLEIRKLSDSLSHELSDVTKITDNKFEETRQELQAKLESLEKQNTFLKRHILEKRFLGSHRFFGSLPKFQFTKHGSTHAQLKDDFNKIHNEN